MRPGRVLAVYLLVVFVGGALLAPWLYVLAQWVAAHHEGLAGLADHRFSRFVSRSVMIVALVGLWPFLRGLGMRNWKDLGLARHERGWPQVSSGLAVGLLSLAIVAMLALNAGARVLDHDLTALDWVEEVGEAALAAVGVALLEETLFRGALFGALRQAHSWKAALLVSSVGYALVHFFARPPSPESVTWTSGLATLGHMFSGLAVGSTLVPGFFTLTLAGAVLAYGYQWTGRLYFSMGMHAGWVFMMKLYGGVTSSQTGVNLSLWGSRKLYDGWVSTLVMAALMAACLWVNRKPLRSHENPNA